MLNSNAFHCNLDSYQPAAERTVQINNQTYPFSTQNRDNTAVAQVMARLSTVCDSSAANSSCSQLSAITKEAIDLLSKAMPESIHILEALPAHKLFVLVQFLRR